MQMLIPLGLALLYRYYPLTLDNIFKLSLTEFYSIFLLSEIKLITVKIGHQQNQHRNEILLSVKLNPH